MIDRERFCKMFFGPRDDLLNYLIRFSCFLGRRICQLGF